MTHEPSLSAIKTSKLCYQSATPHSPTHGS